MTEFDEDGQFVGFIEENQFVNEQKKEEIQVENNSHSDNIFAEKELILETNHVQ